MKSSMVRKLVICLSEVFSSGIVMFLAFGGTIDFTDGKNPPTPLSMCITLGLSILVSVQCFGHISGAHISPVVTVASATMGLTPITEVPVYVFGQTLGSFGGILFLKVITPKQFMLPKNGIGFASPAINNHISPFQGLLMEFAISFILVLVCCGLWDKRNKDKDDSIPMRLGLTVVVLALVAGPYTGANMNPARSLAPALLNSNWQHHWIYWIGPLCAGVLGALVYKTIFGESVEKENSDEAVENGLLKPMLEKPKC